MGLKYSVYIGRFQPFHKGHLATVTQALSESDHLIIVLGSSNVARSIKNPFTVDEREVHISDCLTKDQLGRVTFASVRDYPYDDKRWITEVMNVVGEIATGEDKISLIGYHKDDSSYYLDLFPEWKFIHVTPKHEIDATHIRKLWFEGKNFSHLVPESVSGYMQAYPAYAASFYDTLVDEFKLIQAYKKSWENSPYPPIFVTADAVIFQRNHVLVVTRRDAPGKGLLALPGGFIKADETLQNCMLRELREETHIVFPDEALKSHIVDSAIFDHPRRSNRGRTITTAFCIKLDEKLIPKVVPGDDACGARWIPIQDLYKRENEFFEDHGSIVQFFHERVFK